MTSPRTRFPYIGDVGNLGSIAGPGRAVGKLRAGFATRNEVPCRIVFTGSSTTQGQFATAADRRYVNLLTGMIQAAYPSGLGVEAAVIGSPTAAFGALSAAPGVHAYNAGEQGTDSSNYLTPGEITNIGALNPRAVFHMIGSNDFALGVNPSVFKSRVRSVIAALKAATAGPCAHILVHSYERYDAATHAHPWSAYGQALADLARADPDSVAFIDISSPYYLLGVPGADPLTLMNADKIHQVNAGHALMADLIRDALGIPAATNGSTPAPVITTARLTSDAFTGANAADLLGRASDVVLGGATRTWVGDAAASLAIANGAVTRGANTGAAFFAGIPEGVMDVEASIVMSALPAGTELLFDLHRQAAAIAGSPATYRMLVAANGFFSLAKRPAGGAVALLSGSFPYAVGDRLSLRYHRGFLQARKNGVLLASVADTSITTPGWAGLGGAATLTACGVDDFTLDALT